MRLLHAAGAVRAGVRVGRVDVGHLEGDVDHAVAVLGVVLGARGAAAWTAPRMHEAGRAGGQHVLGVVAVALLRAAVGDQGHAEGGRVVVRRLLGVADQEGDVVDALHREGVVGLLGPWHQRQRSCQQCWSIARRVAQMRP